MKFFSLLPLVAAFALVGAPCAVPALGQQAGGGRDLKGPLGPVGSDFFHTTFVRTGPNNAYGLLYQPETPGPNARVGIVYAAPTALFNFAPAAEMASRGYRVLLVKRYLPNRRQVRETSSDGLREASRGIAYMRAFPGVERVVLMGHDDGGRMAAYYAAAAVQGAAVCQRPGLVYACQKVQVAAVTGLAKPDGIVMLEPSLGAFDTASAVDPAFADKTRSRRDLDMYAASNGYDVKTGQAKYSPDFIKRFYAAQSTRNNQIIDQAATRLKLVEEGKGAFIDDEPFAVAGAANAGIAASLYDADTTLLSSTRQSHLLLKADGSTSKGIVRSVRPVAAPQTPGLLSDCCEKVAFTVRRFLDNEAVRTTPDFALTADNILGVDWKSSSTSTPANAESITVPTLVMAMSCSRSIVPAEIIYDRLPAKDKSYVAVEGAAHDFTPCKPEYGDTKKRTFDFVGNWLAGSGRF